MALMGRYYPRTTTLQDLVRKKWLKVSCIVQNDGHNEDVKFLKHLKQLFATHLTRSDQTIDNRSPALLTMAKLPLWLWD